MKRSKIGLWLLLVLLAGGILSSWGMVRLTEPLGQTMEAASQAALRSDWENAQTLALQARESWEKNWNLCAVFADHTPMENINGLFAQLEIYARSGDAQNFAAVCAQLSEDTKAIGEAHSFTWWNLL